MINRNALLIVVGVRKSMLKALVDFISDESLVCHS